MLILSILCVFFVAPLRVALFKETSDKDTQQIIQNQIKSFVNSHREPMINLISEVLRKNNKPDNILVKTAMKMKSNTK